MPLPTLTDARTPHIGLPYLFAGQAQKEAFVNEAFARLDALVPATVLAERNVPPAAPADGDSFLVAGEPTGAWSGQAGSLAVWMATQWLFCTPRNGARLFDIATGAFARFDLSDGWVRHTAPVLPSGGAIVDSEARSALAAVVSQLRLAGIFSA